MYYWLSLSLALTEAVAFSPRPHPYLPCFAPLTRERLSLCTALQTKILWINWSLNAIDTIETWVSGNLSCPDGTFAAGYTMAHGRGGELCVLRLFGKDIDIYLFGTMITGILLIGLGLPWVIEEFRKTGGTAVQSPTRLPEWLKRGKSGPALRLRL